VAAGRAGGRRAGARLGARRLRPAVTTHDRPDFDIRETRLDGLPVPVDEIVVDATPFGSLLRFRKRFGPPQPKALLLAPMSGHFATLLRGTIEAMLPDHDVYVADWRNARDIPASDGAFGMDEYVDHVVRFQRALGPGAHLIAVCQPCVAALAATAVMAEAGDPCAPASLTLMAGPIDTRRSPTKVNEMARSRSIGWFESNLVATVPWRYAGAGRRVYPGFVQLSAFIGMNLDRHIRAHARQFRALVGGDAEASSAHRRFYDEYAAVMDLPAEFYLETVRRVFQDHDLPEGRMRWRGAPLRLDAIERTSIMVVEGGRDDICGAGQTAAALELCRNVPDARKSLHVQPDVGHYGVFGGSRWTREIYPRVRDAIRRAEAA
jgi:poly(3-hydroxybutyrate) depolymerase